HEFLGLPVEGTVTGRDGLCLELVERPGKSGQQLRRLPRSRAGVLESEREQVLPQLDAVGLGVVAALLQHCQGVGRLVGPGRPDEAEQEEAAGEERYPEEPPEGGVGRSHDGTSSKRSRKQRRDWIVPEPDRGLKRSVPTVTGILPDPTGAQTFLRRAVVLP